MLSAAWHTAAYGVCAGALDTLLALPLAVLAIRHSGAVRHFLERSTYLVLAMPGVVIALALTYFTEQYLGSAGLPDRAAPGALLHDHVLPACAGRSEGRYRQGPGQPGRSRPVTRPEPAGRVQPGHAAPRGARPGGRLLPGLP